jgi:hypothetical protein
MDKIKTILDREPLSSDYIRSRQDFDQIVKVAKVAQKPIWKSAWFYGVTGLSAIAIVIAISVSGWKEQQKEPEVIGQSVDPSEVQPTKPHVKSSGSGNISMAIGNPVKNKVVVQEQTSKPNDREERSIQTPIVKEPVVTKNEEIPVVKSVERREEKPKTTPSNNYMPNFGGVYEGNVPVDLLCSGKGIQSNGKLTVTSFTISYFDGKQDVTARVRGNKIPYDVCEDLGRYNVGTEIFITNIYAEDRFSGATSHLPSMLITPVLSENGL